MTRRAIGTIVDLRCVGRSTPGTGDDVLCLRPRIHENGVTSRQSHHDSQKDRTGNERCNFSLRAHIILPFGIWERFHAAAHSAPVRNAVLLCLEHLPIRDSEDVHASQGGLAAAVAASTHCADGVAAWRLLELMNSRPGATEPASLAAVWMHCRRLVFVEYPALPVLLCFHCCCPDDSFSATRESPGSDAFSSFLLDEPRPLHHRDGWVVRSRFP
jgi:hypothetical protein